MLVKVEHTGEWAPIQKSRVWSGGRKSDVYLPSIWVSWVEEIRHSSPTTESALGESMCAACVVPVVVGDADKIDVRRRLLHNAVYAKNGIESSWISGSVRSSRS